MEKIINRVIINPIPENQEALDNQEAECRRKNAPINTTQKRDKSFDAFRGIAIIAVVAIHAANSGWGWYGKKLGEWNYYFTLAIKQTYVFAVPSFFFISGYFIALKASIIKNHYIQFIRSRLRRILIPYLLWSTTIIFLLQRNFELSNFIYKILLGRAQGPYYFLIALSCLTILSPFLLWLQNKPYALFSIVLVNVITLLVIYYLRISLCGGFPWWKASLPFTTWIIFYYLGIMAGSKKVNPIFLKLTTKKAMFLVLTLLAISEIEALTLVEIYGKSSGADSAVKFSSFFYSLSVILYFMIAKQKIHKVPKLLTVIGEYSFGIYLIHELFRSRISYLLSSYSSLLYSIQPIFQLIVIVLTLTICIIVIYLARKILGRSNACKYLGF